MRSNTFSIVISEIHDKRGPMTAQTSSTFTLEGGKLRRFMILRLVTIISISIFLNQAVSIDSAVH